MLLLVLTMMVTMASAGKSWSNTHHDHSNHIDTGGHHKSHLERLEVVCSKDHMTVHMHFDQPFHGMVFSHGGQRHERCVHVGPRAGIQDASFQIKYDSCGTVEDFGGRFHENTIVVQFGEDILEEWDEAKRLRCEWLENFEKPSSKPTLAISDLDVVELNFQGDDIDCWMEVQEGKGPWARQVGGLVPIGSPLTLVIAINDHSREFDMRIKRCTASDGKGSEIELTDYNGCVSRPSLLTPFAKVRDFGAKATLVAYTHIYAFKFPDKMDVFVHCIVEVCRHGCPDSCGHQVKDYFHPRGPPDSLESKKQQKLIELAKSQAQHASGYHHSSKTSFDDVYPLPGREKNRDILIAAAQEQVQHVTSKNSSFDYTLLDSKRASIYGQRATFKPKILAQLKQKETEKKSEVQGASSNVHTILTDIGNNLHSEHDSKDNPQISHHVHDSQNDKPIESLTRHRIIGHDVHWISEDLKQDNEHHNKHIPPSLKEISYQAPQPEPSAWSADEVKPLTKQEVFHKHPVLKPEVDISSHYLKSQDEHKKSLHEIFHISPQPEPAAWSADEVKPLTKQEVFHHHHASKHEIDLGIRNLEHQTVFKTQVHPVPQPEPAPWKFEEVNPMHSPEILRLKLHTKPPEPQPEPATWTLDDVKPLSKHDLRLLSLNHKFRSNPHIDVPVYKEFLHPYSTSTIPQPVYVPRYTVNPQNMSSSMKMMMMMPTLLPITYQTALWPQRATTRYLRPFRHHYPYPIPQFSSQQQMMLGVIADRRMDEDTEDVTSEDILKNHNLSNKGTTIAGSIRIGDTASGEIHSRNKASSDASMENEMTNAFNHEITTTDSENLDERKILIGETFDTKTTLKSQVSTDSSSDALAFAVETPVTFQTSTDGKLMELLTTAEDHTEEASRRSDAASAVRPPISGFVPPSLDNIGTNPETKDRVLPAPRSLERRKRSSEPVFGVRQKFQAIAPSDLAFEWNLTAESASVFKGRREEIVYGICMSPAGMSASVGFILILTLLSIIASVVLYEHSCLLTKKTSQLSFFTRNFNGQFEALYRITRPYLYSDNR